MPDFLYLDIDSPTLAQCTTYDGYDGYSSPSGSARKSYFAELSPQRWPPEFSHSHFSFDFDPEDGENPFVYDAEASTKGMALPPPPPMSPAAAAAGQNKKQIKSPLLSPGLRRGPLSYYGSIFEHVHFTEIQSPSSPTTINFNIRLNDNNISDFENSGDAKKTESPEQVSPLTPSIECFGLSPPFDRPISDLPIDHPPTPAIQRFQIADNYSNIQNQDCSPVPSLSDSLTGSPRSQEIILDTTQALEKKAPTIKSTKSADPAAVLGSPFTTWPPKSAFSLSSESDGDDSEDDRSEYSSRTMSEYIQGLSSDDEDYGAITRSLEYEIDFHDMLDDRKESKTYEDDTLFCDGSEDEIKNTTYGSPEKNTTFSTGNSQEPGELADSITRASIISYANSDSEMFDQLGIALPLPPPSVQAPVWAGPPVDLKTLIREHLESTGQLKPERKHPTLKPVINNQIHFMPLRGPQSSKSDPSGEGCVDMPQWIPSPETPTFGVRIQNKVKAMLKPEKKNRSTPGDRTSLRTQKLLDEEFKSASLYTRRKKVDRAKIGSPVGPTIMVPDSSMQELVLIAEDLKKLAAEDAKKTGAFNPSTPKPDNSSTVSLPIFNGIKRIDTCESTDDDNSSVEDAFVVHTPLRPRSVLPERDRRRRSHSLPGTFTFTESGVFAENYRRLTKEVQGMIETEEERGTGVKEDTETQEREEMKIRGQGNWDMSMMQLRESSKSKGSLESRRSLEWDGCIDVKDKPNVDPDIEIDDPMIEGYQETVYLNTSKAPGSYRFMDNTPRTSSAASIVSYDDFHEGEDHTVVYEDVMFELIPQRTMSGNSIWLGSDTVSTSGSVSSRKNSIPYTEEGSHQENPQQISPVSTTGSSVSIELSSYRCSPQLESSSSGLPQATPENEYRSKLLDYNSPVQARLIIDPATEILIPFLLEEACGKNPPCSCPRIIYEKTPELSRSPDTWTHDPVPIPEPFLPLHRLKSLGSQKSTTICSPGAGKANGAHVPLRKKSISKPMILKEPGSLASLGHENKDVDSMFMIPTRQPPLPLRRSQSQLSIRPPPLQQPVRRPSDSSIPSSAHLEYDHTPSNISAPKRISNDQPLSGKRNNSVKNVAGFTGLSPPKTPMPSMPSSEKLAREEGKEIETLERFASGKRRLAPPIPKLTLPTSPRPIKDPRPPLTPLSVPKDDHARDRTGKEKHILNPLTPSTGKLIFSASHSPPSSPSRPQTPALSSIRLQPQSYIYIPYSFPRIGGGVISREHRMKFATGRAAKRARKCKECGIQGGGEKEVEMWFCLECGCGWELCGECIKGEKLKQNENNPRPA